MIRQYCICYNVTLLQEYQMPRHLEFIEGSHYVCCMETLRSPSLATCSIKPKTLFLLISVVRIEKYTSFFQFECKGMRYMTISIVKKGKIENPIFRHWIEEMQT